MPLAESHYYGTGLSDPGPDLASLLDLMARARPAWQADALCREHPEVNFFPAQGESAEPAKAICRRCSVAEECAAFGATEGHGIWGGVSARGRSGANVGRILSDGAPARLREVSPMGDTNGLVETSARTPPPPAAPKTTQRPRPVSRPRRVVEKRSTPSTVSDGQRAPSPASCARCPMAVKKGKTLCKGCERDSAPPS